MYTLHVHAVISQLMTLFVPTYSTTNIEIPQNIRFKSFLHVQHTAGILVLFHLWFFYKQVYWQSNCPIGQMKDPQNDASGKAL